MSDAVFVVKSFRFQIDIAEFVLRHLNAVLLDFSLNELVRNGNRPGNAVDHVAFNAGIFRECQNSAAGRDNIVIRVRRKESDFHFPSFHKMLCEVVNC